MHTFTEFTALVKRCIAQAVEIYGPLPDIGICYDLKGLSAGEAVFNRDRYSVRFNREAISKDWDGMVNSTIPHEIAHVVDHFINGKMSHNESWKSIDAALGGTGERCHNYKLTPAKKKSIMRYQYALDSGEVVMIGPKQHKMIQIRYHEWSPLTIKKTGESVCARHFQKAVKIR